MYYFTITTEMTQDLKLKGNELLVYAVIKAHSGGFYGTRSLIANMIGCNSLKTINNCIDSLIEKELIIKQTKIINNQSKNAYFANSKNQITVETLKDYITQDISSSAKDLWVKDLIIDDFNTLTLQVVANSPGLKEMWQTKKPWIERQVNYWNLQHKTNYIFKYEFVGVA